MKSQIYSILRQGIWASLTGGWYYDHNQTHFLNIFHLYSWLFLFSLPIVTYYFLKKLFPLFLDTNFNSAWFLYCLLISVFFLAVKLFNQYLHSLFDKNKFKLDPKSKQVKDGSNINSLNNSNPQQPSVHDAVQRLFTLIRENPVIMEENDGVNYYFR